MFPLCIASILLASDPRTADILARITPERCQANVQRLADFGTRHTLSDTTSDTRGIGAARRWLKQELEAANSGGADGTPGRLDVRLEEFRAPKSVRLPDGADLVNVVAILPGVMTEGGAAKRRYYIVGHYDSINADRMDPTADAPGANDDASGTSVVLEAARALASEKLDATIVFLCTAGEEQGLIGAKYHADQAAARGETILGVLNNDIVGDPSPVFWTDKDTSMSGRFTHPTTGVMMSAVRLFSEGLPPNATAEETARIRANAAESDSPSRQLSRFVAEVAAWENQPVMVMQVHRPDRFLRGGDHSAFNDARFPAVRFTVPGEDYTRQHASVTEKDGKPYGDLPTFTSGEFMASVCRLNVATLIHLANAPSSPGNARIVTAKLETGTNLAWDASPEPDVAGYEVVYRVTTSHEWQSLAAVDAKTLSFGTPVSKDNFFFGVRSIDTAGNKSPVSFCWATATR